MNNKKTLAYFSTSIFLLINLYFLFTVNIENRIINDGYNIISISERLNFGKDYLNTLVSVEKPPLYIVLISIINDFLSANITIIIIFQLCLAFVTAIVAENIYEIFFNKKDYIVFTLVLLNPNLIAHVNFILTETVYSFFLTIVFFYYFKWYSKKKLDSMFLCGLFLGFASLTRYEGIYLMFVIMVLMFFLVLKNKKYKFTIKSLFIFFFAILISYGPWVFANKNSESKNIGTNEKELEHLSWNITLLESTIIRDKIDLNYLHDNKIEFEAKEKFNQILKEKDSLTKSDEINWYRNYYLKKLFSYPFISYVKLWSKSTMKFFFSSGSTYLNILFGNINVKNPENFTLDKNINSNAKNIKFIVLFLNLFLKILCFIGLLKILSKIHDHQYLAALSFVLFSLLIVIFNGHARSRLPIEGLLFLLTVYGYNYLIKFIKIKKNE